MPTKQHLARLIAALQDDRSIAAASFFLLGLIRAEKGDPERVEALRALAYDLGLGEADPYPVTTDLAITVIDAPARVWVERKAQKTVGSEYYYLRWKEKDGDGRDHVRSKYLGKAPPWGR